MDSELLTISQVAAKLKVCKSTVLTLGLPCVFLGKRSRRFVWSDVVAALKGR